MAFGDQDLGIFFRDGRVAVLDDGRSARVHLDHVERLDAFGAGKPGAVAGPPQMTFATADLPDLAHDQAVTIDGVRYRVRGTPRKESDGLVSVADLRVG